ncbi:uncharacterized protein LOC104454830 isoform X2 [Eucalyptus grandis]|uniref:uncharacterized protein LOC104454830 isoform X2 n=1 Tax=Eucalyptus grandis TaxID=71139 RepID=UPI00192EB135|nr:uncharacterized protein LOC104454830 isoform X2 [Eucalyptus grandis]
MQSTRDTKTELFTFSQIAESDFVPMQSTRDTKTELSSSSYAAEDQKEHKPFFGMDWLHTKAGYVTTKGSLQRIPKKEENATMSSEEEKLVAMQKHRAESDFVPMQSTRDAKTEPFTSSHAAEDQKGSFYEDQKEHKPFFGMDWLHTKAGYVTTKGSLQRIPKKEENATMSSEKEKLVAMQKHRAESDFVPMQSTRDAKTELFTSSHAAEDQKGSFYEDQKELKPFYERLHTEPGYVTSKGSLLSLLKEEENATVSSEAEKLVAMQKQRAESDFEPTQSTRDTETELFPCSHAAENQQELKPLFGIDLLHTKAGYVTNDRSLLSDLKEEENATVSSEAEKLVAMQKQRAESDFVPMQSTQDTETELFPWIMKRALILMLLWEKFILIHHTQSGKLVHITQNWKLVHIAQNQNLKTLMRR